MQADWLRPGHGARTGRNTRTAVDVRRSSGRVRVPLLAGIAVLMIAAAGAWFGTRDSADKGPDGHRATGKRAQPVSIASVRRQDMPFDVQAVGTMEALNTTLVTAQVAGLLQSLHFAEGEQVEAGQLLARIDSRTYEAAVAFAEGVLTRDKAQLEGARSDLAVYRNLLKRDAISRQQVDTQAALVRQLEGTVQADEASLATARIQLADTQVRAPITGRVGLKQTDLGNRVQPGVAGSIVTITQTKPIALVFAVPSVRLARLNEQVRAGQPVPVAAWSQDNAKRLADGVVASIDNAIDVNTDTIRVKAIFPNEDDVLFPNQPVSVRLRLDVIRDALTVPRAALLRGARGYYLYVVRDDNTVVVRSVEVGITHDDWIVVTGELQPHDRVVVDGVDRLRDGASIEVIPDDPDKRVAAD